MRERNDREELGKDGIAGKYFWEWDGEREKRVGNFVRMRLRREFME